MLYAAAYINYVKLFILSESKIIFKIKILYLAVFNNMIEL